MISKIVIHCSDTPTGRDVSAAEIHAWHKQGNGWDGIGYHHVIRLDGEVENGRPYYWSGAHASGHNNGSIGICLIGEGEFNDKQYDALYQLLLSVLKRYPAAKICGHGKLDPRKANCPGFNVEDWLDCHNMGAFAL